MKTVSGEFKIKNGQIYFTPAVENFIRLNEGRDGDVTFKLVNQRDVKYWRHKYYRSALLPSIAAESFSGDNFEAHLYLKKRFLFIPAGSVSEIPDKHKNSRSMFVFDGDVLRGVIPSCGDISDDDMRAFVIKVEAVLFDTQASLTAGQMELRKKAF